MVRYTSTRDGVALARLHPGGGGKWSEGFAGFLLGSSWVAKRFLQIIEELSKKLV
jgi:hypothetical protein